MEMGAAEAASSVSVSPVSRMMVPMVVLLLIAIVVLLYLLPTIIAVKKKHLQKVPIILINIFLGWSFIGWVVALVWAFTQSQPNILHIHEENKNIDLSEKIRSLEELRKDGFITDEEFEMKKSELLKSY